MFKGKTFRTKVHIYTFCENFFEFNANEQLFKREIFHFIKIRNVIFLIVFARKFKQLTHLHVVFQVQQSSMTSSLIRMSKIIVRKNIYCVYRLTFQLLRHCFALSPDQRLIKSTFSYVSPLILLLYFFVCIILFSIFKLNRRIKN